jgi:hypothetical protein
LLTHTETAEGALSRTPAKSGLRFWNWKERFVIGLLIEQI